MTDEILARDELQVWCLATEGLTPDAVASHHTLLNAEEQERIERLHFARDRVLHTAAHGLLRRALSAVTGAAPESWRFERAPQGKPHLAPGQAGPAFNLTHTAGLAACVLSWQPDVGVDAEHDRAGEAPLGIVSSVFTAAEQARLADLTGKARAAAFFDFWTLKEAVMKATGQGLALAPQLLEAELAPPWVGGAVDGAWGFALLRPTAAHHLAVAQRGGATALRWRHLGGAWQAQPLNRRPAG